MCQVEKGKRGQYPTPSQLAGSRQVEKGKRGQYPTPSQLAASGPSGLAARNGRISGEREAKPKEETSSPASGHYTYIFNIKRKEKKNLYKLPVTILDQLCTRANLRQKD